MASVEWCICGHHTGNHDMEGEETQDCNGPGCICKVFRPTGQGMPDMNILNEHGSGLEEDYDGEEEEAEAQEPGSETSRDPGGAQGGGQGESEQRGDREPRSAEVIDAEADLDDADLDEDDE